MLSSMLRASALACGSAICSLSFILLFALFYFAIAAGAVTHRDLLLESPVKLPFLNVELPLKAFFTVGPLVFLILHTYILLHFVLLAGKIGTFHLELQAQISGDEARARLRRQLPSNIFVQSFAGPREVRTGVVGFLLRRIIEISLVAGPIALLILFQLQFLPYHSEWIAWWQRIAVVIDVVLLWILWPRIVREETAGLRSSDFKRLKVQAWLLVSILPVLLVVTIVTFPGEWLEENLWPVRLIPTTRAAWALPSLQAIQKEGSGWATLHELLVAGEVNYVTSRPQSVWSNVLVLPNFEIGDRANKVSLRGRSLEGAVLAFAHLRNADFTAPLLRARSSQEPTCARQNSSARISGAGRGFSPQAIRAMTQYAPTSDAPTLLSLSCRAPRSRVRSCRAPSSWTHSCKVPRLLTHSCTAPCFRSCRCRVLRSAVRRCRPPSSRVYSFRAPISLERNCRAHSSLERSCRAPISITRSCRVPRSVKFRSSTRGWTAPRFEAPLFGEPIHHQICTTHSSLSPGLGRNIPGSIALLASAIGRKHPTQRSNRCWGIRWVRAFTFRH